MIVTMMTTALMMIVAGAMILHLSNKTTLKPVPIKTTVKGNGRNVQR